MGLSVSIILQYLIQVGLTIQANKHLDPVNVIPIWRVQPIITKYIVFNKCIFCDYSANGRLKINFYLSHWILFYLIIMEFALIIQNKISVLIRQSNILTKYAVI